MDASRSTQGFPTPRDGLELGELYVVVASSYVKADARQDLPHAVKKAEYVVERFDAKRHEANSAEFVDWLSSPRSKAETVRLALHGYSDPFANEQRLVLGGTRHQHTIRSGDVSNVRRVR